MNNKKGISALLETVLLILVVLAAAGIIFGAVIPMLRAPAERAAACSDLITISATTTNLNILLNKGDVKINSIGASAFNAAGAATQIATVNVPTAVGATTSSNMPAGGPFVKVQVVPVVNTTTGKQIACPPVETQLA